MLIYIFPDNVRRAYFDVCRGVAWRDAAVITCVILVDRYVLALIMATVLTKIRLKSLVNEILR